MSSQNSKFSGKRSGYFGLVLAAGLFWLVAGQAQPIIVTPIYKLSAPSQLTNPRSLVLGKTDGVLYGTLFPSTQIPGKIFRVNRDGTGYTEIYTNLERMATVFEPDLPESRIIQASDGELYGSAPVAGANGDGKVFTLHANGSGYTVLHDFTNTDEFPCTILEGSEGALYGGGGVVYRLNRDGSGYTVLHTFTAAEGYYALGLMVQGNDGVLYGATYGTFGATGTNGECGVIFKVNTNGNGFAVLHTFGVAGDGRNPVGGLMQGSDGTLYGTTSVGGAAGYGTVFKINPDGSNYAILHSFAGATTDGDGPCGELVQVSGGALFGTTFTGGLSNNGTVFQLGSNGSGYSTVFNFTNGDALGIKPITGFVRGQQPGDVGVLYGTTSQNTGSIFAILVNPPLSITPVTGPAPTNQTVVFWPNWAINYKLQSTTNLASGNWSTITDGVPVTGVQITSTNPAVYYRLVSP